jgi:DNA-binding NarL/FixJ family response regulator
MAESAPPIRILLADDHPVVRDGLAAMLSTQPDFAVVGQAGDGDEVVAQAAALQPDIVLLDLAMPGTDGVTALLRLRELLPELGAIVFTAFDSDERILAAVQAGARGYLLKGVPREELFSAIRVVHQGGSLLQPVVASKLLRQLQLGAPASRSAAVALTAREHEVLLAVAEGKTNRAIAEELHITERTVKFHVAALLAKLSASNRTEAVRTAHARGLLDH